MVKFGLVTSDYNAANAGAKVALKSGFAGEICWFQEGLIKANVAVKNLVQDVKSVGIFVSPLMVENLEATVGVSLGMAEDGAMVPAGVAADGYSDLAFDLRAAYAITEKTKVTGMLNYSTASNNDVDGKAMWTMLGLTYVAGDNITFVAALNNTVKDFDAPICTDSEFAFSTGCDIKASEKATVSVGFDANWTNVKPYTGVADISLPISVAFEL